MTKFEDNLWREIERAHGARLAGSEGPLRRRPRVRRPVIAGTSLGVLGASVGAVLVLGAANSSPAYAVTRHSDGTVSVMIRRIDGIRGANRRLAQLGIHARAVLVAGSCQASVSQALRKVPIATLVRDHRVVRLTGGRGWVNARIRPSQIPSHRTLVIPAVRSGAVVRLVRGRAVRGAVPNCLPPAVRLRNIASGAGVTGGSGGRILSCRARFVLGRPPKTVVLSPGTGSGTATDPGTTTDPGTATDPGTMTDPGTTTNWQTVTGSGTTTDPGTATDPGTSTDSGPIWTAAPPNTALPPVLQACLRAARRSTR